MHRLPLAYFDNRQRGEVLSRVTNDIDNLQTSLSMTIAQLFSAVLTVVTVLLMMVTISPVLTGITLVTVPVSVVVTRAIARRSQRLFVAQWTNTGRLNAHIEESYSGFTLVRTFGQRDRIEDEFRRLNDGVYQASFGAQLLSGLVSPATTFISNLSYVGVAVVGGVQVATGQITVGSIQAFIQYVRQFNGPVNQVASMYNTLQSGVASAERVFDLLDEPEESPDRDLSLPSLNGERPTGRVEFEGVSFGYHPGHAGARGSLFHRRAGQHRGDCRPDRGGQDHAGEPADALLRRRLRPHPGRRRRHRDRQQAFAALPDRDGAAGHLAVQRDDRAEHRLRPTRRRCRGDRRRGQGRLRGPVRTHVAGRIRNPGQRRGGNISAGERQLITIARAFLARPQLLILDEATSSVDTRTELLIAKATHELRRERTSFIIAHRLSTIRDADVILVMESGKIVEQGNHGELLARRGAYYRMTQA